MKIRNYESAELLLMTVVFVLGTIWAVYIGHPRAELMIVLTLLLALMSFVARFRHSRQIRTLHAHGRRKKHSA